MNNFFHLALYKSFEGRAIMEKIKLDQKHLNKIYCGESLKLLSTLPDNSIDCIVTSPPYWALRDYGHRDQVGLEVSPEYYINTIVAFVEEFKRVLKPTGTIFLNLGDSFYSGGNKLRGSLCKKSNFLQPKQKLLIPYRIAIKCQEELGLILRNDIHWIKQICNFKTKESWGSCMPSPSQDRLSTHSESIFFFVKDRRYHFNLDSIRIPFKQSTLKRADYKAKFKKKKNKGKNVGDCLMFPLQPSREEHSAMFPPTIPEFCIKCGCPENGIVLDPFMGSGTTALVCKRLKRKFLGFELNPAFCKIAERRLSEQEEENE